jgi:hypothetical protein
MKNKAIVALLLALPGATDLSFAEFDLRCPLCLGSSLPRRSCSVSRPSSVLSPHLIIIIKKQIEENNFAIYHH